MIKKYSVSNFFLTKETQNRLGLLTRQFYTTFEKNSPIIFPPPLLWQIYIGFCDFDPLIFAYLIFLDSVQRVFCR